MESASLLVFIKGILLWQFGGSRLAAARLFVFMCLLNDDCARSSERARIETYLFNQFVFLTSISPAHQSGRGLKRRRYARACFTSVLRPLIRAAEDGNVTGNVAMALEII